MLPLDTGADAMAGIQSGLDLPNPAGLLEPKRQLAHLDQRTPDGYPITARARFPHRPNKGPSWPTLDRPNPTPSPRLGSTPWHRLVRRRTSNDQSSFVCPTTTSTSPKDTQEDPTLSKGS